MYHRIRDMLDDQLSVSPISFEQQMNYLFANGYQVISLDQLYRCIIDGAELPRRCVIITFDDGYRDNYKKAFPILKKYGFAATVFLTTDYIGNNRSFSRYPDEPNLFLSWEQIKEMSKEGFFFGSHSCRHLPLSKISENETKREIEDSKKVIEQRIEKPVNSFCYPFGDFNEVTKKFVIDAGYLGACSIKPGTVSNKSDRYVFRRTEIAPHDSLFDFRKKLAGGYDLLHWAWQRWQRLFSRETK